jgi:hypothetical protein
LGDLNVTIEQNKQTTFLHIHHCHVIWANGKGYTSYSLNIVLIIY